MKIIRKLAGGYLLTAILIFAACKPSPKKETRLFETLPEDSTNISFINKLSYDDQFNVFTYRNFYNGGGVAVGDINNDGLPDIFFPAIWCRISFT